MVDTKLNVGGKNSQYSIIHIFIVTETVSSSAHARTG